VVGLDPNPGMRAVAGRIAPAVEWREGFAESLPFDAATFDAVVSQFGLMFFRDREKALGEMLRVLRPGGRLAVAVWDSLESMPAYAREVELLERRAGRAAADALRAPFVLGDRAALSALFERAGVAGASIVTLTGKARFPSIRTLVEADLRGWLPVMGVEVAEDRIEPILRDAEAALSPWATAGGAAEFDVSAHIVTARAA
jgi:SAM-dependent methyltransferase